VPNAPYCAEKTVTTTLADLEAHIISIKLPEVIDCFDKKRGEPFAYPYPYVNANFSK